MIGPFFYDIHKAPLAKTGKKTSTWKKDKIDILHLLLLLLR